VAGVQHLHPTGNMLQLVYHLALSKFGMMSWKIE
jgi:hypothetical protein